ncbi:MAG: glycerol-3-phosphate dehydrogenase/oxidase [Planctomycetaceae bacterium]
MNRKEMIAALDERGGPWDVIIIGGGATGLGAALEAASRGHRTVLVESHDFAQGTSSRSTKLIHGGVRYLRQGQIGMVRHSLIERQRLLRNAPHIVHSLDFVLPTYRRGARTFYYAGLRMYDLLAGQLFDGRACRLSVDETLQQLPNLRSHGLHGGVRYADGQFDDTRLATTLAKTAASNRAVLANYMKVERLIHASSRITGVVVRDQFTGQEYSLAGRVVLNATGVFAESILRLDDSKAAHSSATANAKNDPPKIAPSQGSHLVLDADFLPGSAALMIPETDDGRVLFAIPWHGKVLLGTTDLAVKEVQRDPRPGRSEIDYLLSHAERYLQRSPAESDVRSMFSGLRPLVGAASGSQSTASLSREHIIHTSDTGLITVIGGKWTTYRQMGEDLINRAEQIGELSRKRSVTGDLKLHGAEQSPAAAFAASHLRIYGSDASKIQELSKEQPALMNPLHPRLPYLAAEVVWAARQEMAVTVEDVLARRTRALFLDAAAAVECAPTVAQLMAKELTQSSEWERQQVVLFQRLAEGYLGGAAQTS